MLHRRGNRDFRKSRSAAQGCAVVIQFSRHEMCSPVSPCSWLPCLRGCLIPSADLDTSGTSQEPRGHFCQKYRYLFSKSEHVLPGTVLSTLHVSIHPLQQIFLLLLFRETEAGRLLAICPETARKWEITTHYLPVELLSYFPRSSSLPFLGNLGR